MTLSTVTSKGQVTIPKAVRDRLRLEAGDKLDFRVEDDGTIRVHPVAKKTSEVFAVFAEKAAQPYSVAEQRDAVKRAFRKRRS